MGSTSIRRRSHTPVHRIMIRNRPIALVIVAGAFLCAGLMTFVDSAMVWSAGRFDLNIGIFFVPTAIGLLRLSSGWRRFALYSLVFNALALVFCIAYELVRPGQMAVNWFGTRTEGALRSAVFGGVIGICFLVGWWSFRTLMRPEIRSLFRSDAEPYGNSVQPH